MKRMFNCSFPTFSHLDVFSHLRVVNTASKMDPMPRPSAKYLYNNLITIMIILIIMIMIII